LRQIGPAVWRHRWFMLFVVSPTLLTAGYYIGVAAPQYESEARFIVRSTDSSGPSVGGGLGQMLGLTGRMSSSQSEAFSIDDYMQSHDAVASLQKSLNLVAMFRSKGADVVARLWRADPSAEALLKYYRRQVSVQYNEDTGITVVRAHAFTPADARDLVQALLTLGEGRVNEFNQRAIQDTLRVSQHEVESAEQQVLAAERALTAFRLREQDIDPSRTSTGQLALMQSLQQQLAQSEVQLAGMAATVRQDSPQYVALRNRIAGLQGQVAHESGRLTGRSGALAPVLADYDQLTLKREFAEKTYTSAMGALETARLQAIRQQLFVVNVVRPNLPEYALYPKGTMMIATVFLAFLLAYCIGWLMIAGMREHAA
jgi:capsular polysaccharide transport system permease protein